MDTLTSAVANAGNLAVTVAVLGYVSLFSVIVYLLRDRSERDKERDRSREASDKAIAESNVKLAESLTRLCVTVERIAR